MRAGSADWHVFAPTQNDRRRGHFFQFRAQHESVFQRPLKAPPFLPGAELFARFVRPSGSRFTGNRAFYQSQIETADARRLTGALRAAD